DYLIILDACRYDYFKEQYKNYKNLRKGKLEKRKSRGSNTTEWLFKTFKKPIKNSTYISTSPWINSKGITFKERVTKDNKNNISNKDWKPTKYFDNIIDVWKNRWNSEIGTVTPEEVNKAVKNNLNNEKTIIHYMQPHEPYLAYYTKTNKNQALFRKIFNKFWSKIGEKIFIKILPIWNRLPRKTRISIRKIIGKKENTSLFEKFRKEDRIDELKNYYSENLKLVLEQVSRLIEDIDGKIIITADHGEAFGEQGEWKHPLKSDNPVLREVPWLEIDKRKSEKTKIKEKARNLK
ncbi:MAG: hypothetical protein ACOCTT_03170, partial [archaeon]